jgi:pSer/pThr/pTyr-binding forkhead associated (FHA) protein
MGRSMPLAASRLYGVATGGRGCVPVTTQPSTAVPRLVMLAPESFRGRQIELVADYLTVGREPACDVRLDDPHVSRTHAALQRRGGSVYVQDLGSSGGTFVNGSPATRAELRHGDVVTFAVVQARFESAAPVTAATQMIDQVSDQARVGAAQAGLLPAQDRVPPAQDRVPPAWGGVPGLSAQPPYQDGVSLSRAPQEEPATPVPPQPAPVRYEIGQQDAQVISNVGRDQYNAHVQQVIQQRDSFLRDVAATRTKARWLVWLGLLLFIGGGALFAAADLNFIKQIATDIQNNSSAPPANPLGRPVFGIPSGLLGWAIAAIGAVMLVIGIVLHIVATSRRRRVEREYPMPVLWPNGPPGTAR